MTALTSIGPGRTWRRVAGRIDAATPVSRDRSLDGLRALAVLGVVTGHWLVMALTITGAGALQVSSPLVHLGGFAPVSWVLQMLGLFFLVGGYAAARSLDRAAARGEGYRAWVRRRLARLGRPVLAATAALGAALPVLALAGVPEATLRTTATLVVQPLWFIGVYAAVTALTPVALALDRRMGVYAPVPGLVVVAGVDLLRYGPWHGLVPDWVGLLNVLPGWSFGFLLGVAWARGRIGRRGAAVLAAAGAVLGLILVLRLGYPASMVGVPGRGRVNSHPPSLLVPALAAVQSGLAILLADRIGALLRRPALWAGVALINLSALTIFCWHQIALMAFSAATLQITPGGVPGLHSAPETPGWVIARLAWFPLYAAVLGGLVLAARRFEEPWRGVPQAGRVAAGALAACFGGYVIVGL
jgi:peptidoglycan/LPS O-acetylase OafA/YrhL